MNDSNTIDVAIKVASKGQWTMSTGIVEGFQFSGTGYFTSTGNQTIKLKGSGTPLASGQFPFPLKTDSSNCSFLVSVDLDTTSNTHHHHLNKVLLLKQVRIKQLHYQTTQ